jgi:hypothetical protein
MDLNMEQGGGTWSLGEVRNYNFSICEKYTEEGGEVGGSQNGGGGGVKKGVFQRKPCAKTSPDNILFSRHPPLVGGPVRILIWWNPDLDPDLHQNWDSETGDVIYTFQLNVGDDKLYFTLPTYVGDAR